MTKYLHTANPTGQGGFKKGKSGNPGGRPKVEGPIRELAKQQSAAAIETLAEIMLDKTAPPAARVTAATALLDRAFGRPAQALSLELQRRNFDELSDDELKAIASGDIIDGVAIEGELQ